MDLKSKERFDKILEKPSTEFTKDEIAFLKARRAYLKKPQLEEYKNILIQTPKGTVKKKNVKKEK